MKEHDLKVWREPFAALKAGTKTFEFRKNDRDFQVGDVLHLKEWDHLIGDPHVKCKGRVWDSGDYMDCPTKTMPCPIHGSGDWGSYTAERLKMRVTYILRGPSFGVPDGYVVMSVVPVPPIHILLEGRSICGQAGVPATWPEGERWVRLSEAKDATCQRCLTVYVQLTEAPPP